MLLEMEIGKQIELTKQRKGVKRYRGYYVSLYGQYLAPFEISDLQSCLRLCNSPIISLPNSMYDTTPTSHNNTHVQGNDFVGARL